jgi:hypothetical protein
MNAYGYGSVIHEITDETGAILYGEWLDRRLIDRWPHLV